MNIRLQCSLLSLPSFGPFLTSPFSEIHGLHRAFPVHSSPQQPRGHLCPISASGVQAILTSASDPGQENKTSASPQSLHSLTTVICWWTSTVTPVCPIRVHHRILLGHVTQVCPTRMHPRVLAGACDSCLSNQNSSQSPGWGM